MPKSFAELLIVSFLCTLLLGSILHFASRHQKRCLQFQHNLSIRENVLRLRIEGTKLVSTHPIVHVSDEAITFCNDKTCDDPIQWRLQESAHGHLTSRLGTKAVMWISPNIHQELLLGIKQWRWRKQLKLLACELLFENGGGSWVVLFALP